MPLLYIMNQQFNGRVDIASPDTKSLFDMYDKIPAHQCTTYRDALEGQWDTSQLSDAYFSKENRIKRKEIFKFSLILFVLIIILIRSIFGLL